MTEVFAHRGLSGLYPENTMIAFKAAAKLPIDGIELDVQLTKDNVPIVIHDVTLDRTTEGRGMVREHTLDQIRSYSAGTWYSEQFRVEKVPTLEEVLVWAKEETLKLNIELKGPAWEREELWEAVKLLIDRYNMIEQVIISSFDHVLIAKIQKEVPMLETAVIVVSGMYQPLSYIQTIGTKGFHYFFPLMLEHEVKPLMEAGVLVRPYTINDKQMLKKAFQSKVTAIFTDYPHIALQLKDE
ncbi:glycerophosphodiester phosphodiesterase [Alkalihalobacterium elongatum]|uniref:glycerophosphodiester phosphodiesterase n=1 Tax=Alkalihalobacterium elongatum TaxID=2675466 RepID=UPI001C1FBFF9|nr:glycerophosphodiester phosphodiesterase [Alkalihalobacterium elongatum]